MNPHLQRVQPIVLRGVADLLWPPGSTVVHLTDDERILSAHRLVFVDRDERACRYYGVCLGIAGESQLLGLQLCVDGLPRLGAQL
jgi:hypothetical protein